MVPKEAANNGCAPTRDTENPLTLALGDSDTQTGDDARQVLPFGAGA